MVLEAMTLPEFKGQVLTYETAGARGTAPKLAKTVLNLSVLWASGGVNNLMQPAVVFIISSSINHLIY